MAMKAQNGRNHQKNKTKQNKKKNKQTVNMQGQT